MKIQRHIFISYSNQQFEFALKLAADLRNDGVNIWIDRLDGIRGGEEWRRSIEKALTRSSCIAMIALLSPDYLNGNYCLKELARAERLKIQIFPVLLQDLPDEEIPLDIEGIQWISFTDLDSYNQESYKSRLRELINILPNEQKRSQPPAKARYLTSLIAKLESTFGVLEYVNLVGKSDSLADIRPEPRYEDEWGYTLLVQSQAELIKITDSKPHSGDTLKKVTVESIQETVERYSKFALIGNPGAGKTTTLRRLMLDMAYRCLSKPEETSIPLMISLSEWDTEPTFSGFINTKWSLPGKLDEMIISGEVFLCLDGLNEMGSEGTRKARLLNEWIKEYLPRNLIVSCRAGDYVSDLKLDLPTVLIDELNVKQIRQFAVNYLHERANQFLEQILVTDAESLSTLSSFVKNPYMLSALIIIFKNGGSLPQNTGALFQGLVKALWERERLRGTIGWIIFERAEALFAELAFAMIDEGTPTEVPLSFAMQYLGEENYRLLLAGQSANFIEIRGNQIRFYHQLMQEYFAAVKLAGSRIKDYLYKPDFEEAIDIELFWGWYTRIENKWDQVVIAVCGIIENTTYTIRTITEIDPYLAARCILSGVNVAYSETQNTIRCLVNALQDANSSARLAAASHLSQLDWEPFTIQEKLDLYIALHDWEACLTVGEEGYALLEDYLSKWQNDGFVMEGLEWVLEVLDDLLFVLEEPLTEIFHWNSDIRELAARTLGTLADKSAVPSLIALLNDSNWFVQRTAAQALWEIGTREALNAEKEWRRREVSLSRKNR